MFLRRELMPRRRQDWDCQVIPAAEAHPLCRDLLDWAAERADGAEGAVPKVSVAAENFPPRLLPHLALLEVLEGGAFRYRLFGTARRDAYGADLTGRLLSEVETGEPNTHTHRLFNSVVETRRPIVTRTRYAGLDRIAYDRVIIPLADASGTVRWVLTTVQKIEGPEHRTVLEMSKHAG